MQYREEEQVEYLDQLMAAFKTSGISYAFWFTFADYEKRYDKNPKYNLDMASYRIMQMQTKS